MAITSYKAVMGYYNSAGTPNITAAVTGQLSDGWIPIGAPILTDAYGQCTQMMAKTDATPVIATSAYTVVTAANPQPPDATWDAQGEPLWIDTATYLQAYTKGGAYLQGTVPVSRGGTGATTTLAAAANLRVFAIPNNLSEITDRSAAWLNVRPTGPLPLGGDPVNDYDATTMRWVKNYVDAGGGGGGASMNGVMNYGVGQLTLWHSRAFIPSYAVVADGQLLSRAAYPELWAHAQMHSPVTDAVWLTGVTNRAKFSTGDGSTTFRVPDLNGVQSGSVRGLFGRGSSGADEYSQPGRVLESALPNITGSFTTNSFQYEAGTAYPLVGNRTGAFVQGGVLSDTALPFSTVEFNRPAYATDFNANANNPVYGRYNTAEVVPNSFVGVWIIRANGGFTAANTQWQVINGDATTPSTGVTVNGGMIQSTYKIGSTVNFETLSQSFKQIGGDGTTRGHRIVLQNGGVAERNFSFTVDGSPLSTGLSGNYQLLTSAVSDVNVKHDIVPATVDKPWNNIKALEFNTFVYNNDTQGRQRRGLIAQQVETVDSLYVKTRLYPGLTDDAPDITQKELDTTPMLLDTMHVVQKLIAEIDALKAEVAFLKSGK